MKNDILGDGGNELAVPCWNTGFIKNDIRGDDWNGTPVRAKMTLSEMTGMSWQVSARTPVRSKMIFSEMTGMSWQRHARTSFLTKHGIHGDDWDGTPVRAKMIFSEMKISPTRIFNFHIERIGRAMTFRHQTGIFAWKPAPMIKCMFDVRM